LLEVVAPGDRPASAAALAAMLLADADRQWTDDEAAAWWDQNLPVTSALRTFNQTPINTPAIMRKR